MVTVAWLFTDDDMVHVYQFDEPGEAVYFAQLLWYIGAKNVVVDRPTPPLPPKWETE